MNCTIFNCNHINCLKGLSELFIFRRTPYSVKKLILEGLKRFLSEHIILVIENLLTPSLIIKNYSLTIIPVSSLMIFTDVQTVSRVHITPFIKVSKCQTK